MADSTRAAGRELVARSHRVADRHVGTRHIHAGIRHILVGSPHCRAILDGRDPRPDTPCHSRRHDQRVRAIVTIR